jgi:hypothetical protein
MMVHDEKEIRFFSFQKEEHPSYSIFYLFISDYK